MFSMKSEYIQVRVSPEFKKAFKGLVKDRGITMSSFLEAMIQEAVVNAGTKSDPVQEKLVELEIRIRRIESNSNVSTW